MIDEYLQHITVALSKRLKTFQETFTLLLLYMKLLIKTGEVFIYD